MLSWSMFALLSLLLPALVSCASLQRKEETNAERLRRGLAPLRPEKLFDASRTGAYITPIAQEGALMRFPVRRSASTSSIHQRSVRPLPTPSLLLAPHLYLTRRTPVAGQVGVFLQDGTVSC